MPGGTGGGGTAGTVGSGGLGTVPGITSHSSSGAVSEALTTLDEIVVINEPVETGGSFFSTTGGQGWQRGAPPIGFPSGPMEVTRL